MSNGIKTMKFYEGAGNSSAQVRTGMSEKELIAHARQHGWAVREVDGAVFIEAGMVEELAAKARGQK